MKNDKELFLRCACSEPFHSVHFCYDFSSKDLEFFQISFQAFQGSIWKRIKRAGRVIFSGWVDAEPSWTCINTDRVRELRDFCNQCIAAKEKADEEV